MIGILAGIHTEAELDARFGTEAACQATLAAWRWPNGFQCSNPSCPSGTGRFLEARRTWYCTRCARQASATSGTVFARTKKPLPLWFKAIWLFLRYSKQEADPSLVEVMTATRLMEELGLTRYQTAWAWTQRIRELVARLRLDRQCSTRFQTLLWAALKAKGTRGKRAWGSPEPSTSRNAGRSKWYQAPLTRLRGALREGRVTPLSEALQAWLERVSRPPVSRKHFGRWLAEGVMRCWQASQIVQGWPQPEKHTSLTYWRIILRADASTRLQPAFGS